MKKCAGFVVTSMLAVSNLFAAPVAVQSPDGQVAASFDVENGELFYSVSKGGKPVVGSSKVEIFAGAEMAVVQQSIRENDSSWTPVYGQFSSIRDHHRELTLSLTADSMPVKLLCRAYDSGIGFRFALSKESQGKELSFSTGYNVLNNAATYSGQRGAEVGSLAKAVRVSVPLVTERKDGLHVALLESDLYSATGFESMRIRFSAAAKGLVAASSAVSVGEGQLTPWRVILFGETAGDLTVNTVALNLAAPCRLADTRWIKPGKGLWDWRIHGYNNGEFVYGIDTRSYLHLINVCAQQGLEYFTIDDHWFKTAGNGKMTVAPEVDIAKVRAYAKEKGVMIMPAAWDDTRVLNSKIGNYITVARRSGAVWFVGSVCDQTERTLDIPLDFLEPGKGYEATLYQDASDAHGVKNPEAYEIATATVKQGDVIPAKMAVGGVHAMIVRPAK